MIPQANSLIECPARIAAVRLAQNRRGDPKLGDVTHIEAGTRLEICDLGYNDRTVKVIASNQFFYVFKQDIGMS